MNKTIIVTIINLFRLCGFRGSPADLPYSRPLLITLVLIVVGTAIAFSPPMFTIGESFLEKSLSTAILIGVLYGLLWRKKLVSRLHKTLIAWFGTELLTDCVGIAIFGANPSQEPNVGSILFLIWLLLIKSYILKQTFSLSMALAFLLLLGILIPTSIPFMIIFSPQLPTQ